MTRLSFILALLGLVFVAQQATCMPMSETDSFMSMSGGNADASEFDVAGFEPENAAHFEAVDQADAAAGIGSDQLADIERDLKNRAQTEMGFTDTENTVSEFFSGVVPDMLPSSMRHPVTFSRYWSSWHNLGGTCAHDPIAVSIKNEGIDMFCTSPSGNVMYRAGHHGKLGSWVNLGGGAACVPAVVANKDGSIDVVIRTRTNNVSHRHYEGGKWGSWTSLGFTTHYQPAIAAWYNRGLFIFAVGTNGHVYKVERRHGGFWHSPTSWVSLGGHFKGPLSATGILKHLSQDVYCFALSSSGHLYITRFTVHNANDKLGNWIGKWVYMGITTSSAPALYPRTNGFDIAVYVHGGIKVRSYKLPGRWDNWYSLRCNHCTGRPSIVSHDKGFTVVFVLSGGTYWSTTRSYFGKPFGSWHRFSGHFTSSPCGITRENKYVDIFGIYHSTMYHSYVSFH